MKHREEDVRGAVRNRYARAATGGSDCGCGPSCCGGTESSDEVSRSLGYSLEELATLPAGADLGLGCGNPTAIAELLEGQTALDLGSGAGIDCFLASRQVGPSGHVIGVDMTPEMLEKARANGEAGGYDNVEFRLGEIEALPVADETVDVVISNCVLNLSTNRGRALSEAYRVLKPGGRIAISDMVSDLPVPSVVEGSLDAVAGCLPTAREDYLEEFRTAGFTDVRIADERPYPSSYILEDGAVQAFLREHAEAREALEAFASSIYGAHIEGRKP